MLLGIELTTLQVLYHSATAVPTFLKLTKVKFVNFHFNVQSYKGSTYNFKLLVSIVITVKLPSVVHSDLNKVSH